MADRNGVGGRVAEQRKLRGLTQAQLSQRAHVSLSLVRKVEQGSVPPSPSFTVAVAKVLGTTVAELYEQPSPRFGSERSLWLSWRQQLWRAPTRCSTALSRTLSG